MITRLFYFITHHFKQPIYFYSRPWLIIGLNIVLSALIMIFYEPFGYHFDSWAECTQLIGFCVITFFSSVLFFLCIPQEPHVKGWLNHWTIGKNCLYSIAFLLFTGIAISFYDFHLIMLHRAEDYGTHAFYICLLTDIVGTFTVGIVPLSIGLMLEHSHHLEQNLEKFRKEQACRKSPILSDKHISQEETNNQNMVLPAEDFSEMSVANMTIDSDNSKITDELKESVNPNNLGISKGIHTSEHLIMASEKRSDSLIKNTVAFNEDLETEKSTNTILLTGDTKENLEVSPSQILLIEASGNYVSSVTSPIW